VRSVSIRRACSTLRIDRALYVYKSKRGDQAALKDRIKNISETRVRYGYRRVHVLLQRDGWAGLLTSSASIVFIGS
jgi:putative transposase